MATDRAGQPARRCHHPSGNVANKLLGLSVAILRTRLRPAYGDGFQGAPLVSTEPREMPAHG
jgi:hypothetical protein